MRARLPWIWLTALFIAGATQAVEFSADTYQLGPQGVERTGKLYFGVGRVRTDSLAEQGETIRIVDQEAGRQWVLYPGGKDFVEEPLEGMLVEVGEGGEFSPCDGVVGASCEKLGHERIAGRAAVKWRMTVEHQGARQTIEQWIDKDRAIPLRSEMSNGRRMEMRMVGADTMDGRQVEKWEMVMWGGTRQMPQRSYQWFDPRLGLVIKEELPGGFVRELRNIKVEPQPDHLFRIAADPGRAPGARAK